MKVALLNQRLVLKHNFFTESLQEHHRELRDGVIILGFRLKHNVNTILIQSLVTSLSVTQRDNFVIFPVMNYNRNFF
jgi:hypothetical protein